ncbi:MAG: S8 family serine peptidase, partial [Planctomycetes bacterium]|nr:S8 family serine peptidase [Planctomycetota bacterium]
MKIHLAGRPGYQLRHSINNTPPPDKKLLDIAVGVRPAEGAEVPSETEVARIGRYKLVSFPLANAGQEGAPPRSTPLIARRRGAAREELGSTERVGLDTAIWTRARFGAPPVPKSRGLALVETPTEESVLPPPLVPLIEVLGRIGALEAAGVIPAKAEGQPIVVAVIDVGFHRTEDFEFAEDSRVGPIEFVAFPREEKHAPSRDSHGNRMIGALFSALSLRQEGPPFLIRRIEIPKDSSYLGPMDVALAVARAVAPADNGLAATPAADVVYIPLSSGAWGMPLPLDVVLTEAARVGRNQLGAVILCSSGQHGDNIPVEGDLEFPFDSVAIGADELGAHPDTFVVTACDLNGQWLRLGRHNPPMGAPDSPGPKLRRDMGIAGRMGPSVGVAAPGVVTMLPVRPGHTPLDADGTSLASSLVAAAAARVLQANGQLDAVQVRRILRRTADVPHAVDRDCGEEAAANSSLDRSGHNFKIGTGMVNV